MTEIVLKSHAVQKSDSGIALWLRSAFEWLRQAGVAARLPDESVEDLSDRSCATSASSAGTSQRR
ncbi:hypothetical protein [Mesorhizobium sp.]|uniref:hypothetical protein n=1 Tax=Mesorhizobium sp. TaxID=1871066 RepID=UPI0026C38D15